MTRWAPQLTDVLDALAAEILHNYGKGRAIVAVDGFVGTSEFADHLADALKRAGHAAYRASIRHFHYPRVLRYPAGSLALPATYDLDTLHRVLLDPFRDGGTGSFVLAAFDADRDMPIEPKWITAKPDAILIIDGEQLLGPELRGLWNYSIWVDGGPADAEYVKKQKPSTRATAIVDNSDPERPRRVFADSC